MEFKENYIESVLKKYFQRDVSFYVDNIEYKSGKFILYKFYLYSNNYFIEFHIQTAKKIDSIKIPYPFSVEEDEEDGLLYFDYRLKTLCKDNTKLINKIHDFAKTQEDIDINKFYDKILEIKFT